MAGPEAVNSILHKSLDDIGILSKARRFQVFVLWNEIVGEVAKHTKPRRIDGDILYVATSSSVWAQELSMMRRRIILQINRALGGSYISDIHFSEHMWSATAYAPSEEIDSFSSKLQAFKFVPHQVPCENLQSLSHVFNKFAFTMEKRKSYLLANGYEECPLCGYIYKSYSKCPKCSARTDFYNKMKLLAVLKKHPEMTDDLLSKATGIARNDLFETARDTLDSMWYRIAINGVFRHEAGQLSSAEILQLQALIKNLASLRSKKHCDSLTQKDYERFLGKKMSGLLKQRRRKRSSFKTGFSH